MKSSSGLHLKTFVLLLLMVTLGPLGDVLLVCRSVMHVWHGRG